MAAVLRSQGKSFPDVGNARARHRSRRAVALSLFGLLAFMGVDQGQAHAGRPDLLREVGLDQRLNEQLPLDLAFRDEAGRSVELRRFFGKRPVILVLAYYECRTLCPLVLDGLLKSLRVLSFDAGREFSVVVASIDPRETPAVAAARKAKYIERYGRPGTAEGFHFLSGDAASIGKLTRSVGFRYAYDATTAQFAHASGILVLTPQGRIARVFSGIEFSPKDLRLSLVEASANRIGSVLDQVLLYCYRYDPATGKYGLVIMNTIRLGGLATVLALGTFITLMVRRERRGRWTA